MVGWLCSRGPSLLTSGVECLWRKTQKRIAVGGHGGRDWEGRGVRHWRWTFILYPFMIFENHVFIAFKKLLYVKKTLVRSHGTRSL